MCKPLSLPSQKREFSSAGSEHLPYKQRVGGSNPSTPTQYQQGFQVIEALFYCPASSLDIDGIKQFVKMFLWFS